MLSRSSAAAPPRSFCFVEESERRTADLLARTQLPILKCEIRCAHSHDPEAFTQGLCFRDGHLLESTGWWGRSTIRQVRIEDGAVLKRTSLPANVFGEGLVAWEQELISLTWRDGMGFRWAEDTLQEKSRFAWSGEGWGITHNGSALVISDGSPEIRFVHPSTLQELRRIEVSAAGQKLPYLNDLEWAEGALYANVWMKDLLAIIDPRTGLVEAWVDLRGLRRSAHATGYNEVLNGIAYDAERRRFFVTGKYWPHLFEMGLPS
jgi:glutaminyl-peptide cyclotransferase